MGKRARKRAASSEKGAALLLDAWQALPEVPLTLVGDGPEAGALREQAKRLPAVRFTGTLDREGVRAELARAAFLVAPSLCYETFGDRKRDFESHGRYMAQCSHLLAPAAVVRRLSFHLSLSYKSPDSREQWVSGLHFVRRDLH